VAVAIDATLPYASHSKSRQTDNLNPNDGADVNPKDLLAALGNPMDLMRKAREMQDNMQRVQEELAKQTVTADAGGGMVTAVVNGRMEVVKVRIDRSKIDPAADTEMLEDVITAAIAAAQAKAAAMMQDRMQKMAADAGIPAGMLPGM
jgi:DNA-binding YbaB/EbfC family protein